MTDEALDAERLEEIARGFEGYPTPVDHQGKCWFCNGGLGHGPHGHAESCIWVHRDDLGDGIAELRARISAAEARSVRLAEALRWYADIRQYNRVAGDAEGEMPPIVWERGARARAALAEHDAAAKGEG